jgi:hypothetical protein
LNGRSHFWSQKPLLGSEIQTPIISSNHEPNGCSQEPKWNLKAPFANGGWSPAFYEAEPPLMNTSAERTTLRTPNFTPYSI